MENVEKVKNELFLATTDTVVGIGAVVSEENKARIFKIKNRPANKKLVIMIADIEQLESMYNWSESDLLYAKKYWPGPVTLILKGQAFRIPKSFKLIDLIKKIGPIYMTSANLSGKKTLSLHEAKKTFPTINVIYDFGEGNGFASTVYDLDSKKTLRKGIIKVTEVK